MPELTDLLAKVPLFAEVPKKELSSLAQAAHDVTYEPGKHIASQDELGTLFFVVVDGEAEVSVGGQTRRRLRAGDYFGEMSIIDRSPRSADVVAVTALRCLVFTQWSFRPFLKDHPDVAWGMLEVLVRRLRDVEASGPNDDA